MTTRMTMLTALALSLMSDFIVFPEVVRRCLDAGAGDEPQPGVLAAATQPGRVLWFPRP